MTTVSPSLTKAIVSASRLSTTGWGLVILAPPVPMVVRSAVCPQPLVRQGIIA